MRTQSSFLVAIVSLALLSTACGNSNSDSQNSSSTRPATDGMVYASDWSEISIEANLAKTKVTASGHFETNRNACGRPADGAMSLDEWNTFAKSVNNALKSPTVPAVARTTSDDGTTTDGKTCFDVDWRACMDGRAEIVLGDGSRQLLFEPGPGGQICTRIADRALAEALYKTINGITFAADRADCTLDWERCSR